MKKVFSEIVLTCSVLFLLAGCGTNGNTNSDAGSDNQSGDQSSEEIEVSEGELPLSKALTDFKLWYVFSKDKVTKESVPSRILYFDGNSVKDYNFVSSNSDFYIQDEIQFLNITDLLTKNESEQLKYAESFSNIKSLDNMSPEAKEGDRYVVSNSPEQPTAPYKINLITDGTGNNTSLEEIKTRYYNITGNSDVGYSWEQLDGNYSVESAYASAQIYDHILMGFTLENGSKILTEIGDKKVKFSLDTPQTKSKAITVDSND